MAGRPVGAKNKFPMHQKIHDELLKHNFEWIPRFAKLYENLMPGEQLTALLGLAPYLFPKRKPEDESGDASEPALLGISVTDDQLGRLVKIARGDG